MLDEEHRDLVLVAELLDEAAEIWGFLVVPVRRRARRRGSGARPRSQRPRKLDALQRCERRSEIAGNRAIGPEPT